MKSNVEIIVLGTNNKPKQKFDKRDVCFFCSVSVLSTSLGDHLARRHGGEVLVEEILRLPKRSSKRRQLFQVIRNKGNFEYNRTVLKCGGNLIVTQRPTISRNISQDIDSYVACSRCYGFYRKDDLYRHKCPVVESAVNTNKLLPSQLVCTTERDIDLAEFFRRMHNDTITSVAKEDETIQEFVTQEIHKTGIKSFNTIANKVRLLGEFLMESRKYLNDGKVTLSNVLALQNVSCTREVLKKMFKYDVSGNVGDLKITLERPSSAIRLKQTLDKVAVLLHIIALKESNWTKANEFGNLPLLLSYYLDPISSNARKTMKCSSSGLPQSLPEAETISRLVNYLDDSLQALPKDMCNRRTISEMALARIIVFNKRRSGEVAKMTIQQWNSRNRWKDDVLKDAKSLDETEKILVENFDLIYVNGKGGRYVPVIIPPIVTSTMKWLVETSNNKFVFCNQVGGYLRGHDAVRNSVINAGIESEAAINSTKFRKLSATTLQVSSNCQI